MNKNYKTILLCTVGAFLLVSCRPVDHEGKPAEQQEAVKPPAKEERPDTTLMYPEHPGEKLTPQQQQEEINEDNVMNPFPG